MLSDKANVEYENDRTKLFSQNIAGSTGDQHHGELGEFIYPHSDSEINQHDIELCETKPLNENSGTNGNNQFSSVDKVSRASLIPEVPKRFINLFLIFLANFNMFCIRMCLNVTIVAMTRGERKQNYTTGLHLSMYREPEFHWDKQFQGTILASLYWSYTAMQIPSGLLCVKYGGSFLLGIAIFGSSVLTLATPFIIRQSVYAFIFLRILEGAFLGLVCTAGITLISKWSPVYERSVFVTVGSAGFLFGTVFANSVSGILAGSSLGWPSVFYYFGVQGVMWYLCWLYFAYEEPSDHPNITKTEEELIGKHCRNSKLPLCDIPWRCILSSMQVWAIIVAGFTDCWSFYTFMISFPSYLKDVQDLDITTIGLASSLPYVLSGVLTPSWGYFIDCLRRKKYISTTNSRKLSSFMGAGVSAIFIIAMAHASSITSAIIIVTVAIILSNLNVSGPSANVVELAPKYSGILKGVTNFACNIAGFISPEVVGALTVHGDPSQQWTIVFYITGGFNILGMIFYCCFASSESPAWAEY